MNYIFNRQINRNIVNRRILYTGLNLTYVTGSGGHYRTLIVHDVETLCVDQSDILKSWLCSRNGCISLYGTVDMKAKQWSMVTGELGVKKREEKIAVKRREECTLCLRKWFKKQSASSVCDCFLLHFLKESKEFIHWSRFWELLCSLNSLFDEARQAYGTF
jgi:hypothetical protein